MRQKRSTRIETLQNLLPIAESEDRWDAILAEMHGIGPDGGVIGGHSDSSRGEKTTRHQRQGLVRSLGEPLWVAEMNNALEATFGYLNTAKAKAHQHAVEMWRIVKQERVLAESEKRTRKRRKDVERRARKEKERLHDEGEKERGGDNYDGGGASMVKGVAASSGSV